MSYLELSVTEAVLLCFMFFVAGKILQQGGVCFGRGQGWQLVTFLGAMLMLISFGLMFFLGLS